MTRLADAGTLATVAMRVVCGILVSVVCLTACGRSESDAEGSGGASGAPATGGGGSGGTAGSAGTVSACGSSGTVTALGVVSGSGTDSYLAIDATSDGGMVVAGAFAGEIDLLGAHYTAPAHGGYVMRLSAAGQPVWARVLGEGDDTMPSTVAVAPSGDVWVAGGYSGNTDFGLGPTPADHDLFLLRLGADGTPASVWTFDSLTFASPAQSRGAVAVAPSGEVYFSAPHTRLFDVGGFQIPYGPDSAPCGEAFVAKLDSSLVFQWANRYAGMGGSLDASNAGFALIGKLNCNAVENSALVVGDPQGAVSLEDTGGAWTGRGAALLPNGGVVTAGKAGSKGKITGIGTPGGTWQRLFGSDSSTGLAFPKDVAVDAAGRIAVVGAFRGTLEIDGVSYVTALDGQDPEPASAVDIFAVLLDAKGSVLSVERFGGTGVDDPGTVAFDPGGAVLIGGVTKSDHPLPEGLHTHQDRDGLFVRWCP